jgi:hypothetical protein
LPKEVEQMREIDPIREPSEALLSSALHRLVKAEKRNAPPELGANLLENFRHYHRRRRQVRLAVMGAIAACLLTLASLVGVRYTVHTARQQLPVAVPQQGTEVGANTPNVSPGPGPSQHQATSSNAANRTQGANDEGFIPLPSYDPAVASSELQMVRVEVTGSQLRMLGARVSGDLSDRPVLADFITDRDGTPYAVRLVQ